MNSTFTTARNLIGKGELKESIQVITDFLEKDKKLDSKVKGKYSEGLSTFSNSYNALENKYATDQIGQGELLKGKNSLSNSLLDLFDKIETALKKAIQKEQASKKKPALKKEPFQIPYYAIALALGVISGINALVKFFTNLQLLPPWVLIVGIVILVILWLVLEHLSRGYESEEIPKDAPKEAKIFKILPLEFKHRAAFGVFLIFLTLPLIPISTSIDHRKETCEFQEADSTFLRISLLPFFSDKEIVGRRTEYRTQLVDRLRKMTAESNLNLKIKSCDSLKYTPVTYDEALKAGEQLNADILIWGRTEDHSDLEQSNQVQIQYALLKDWYIDPSKREGTTGLQPLETPSHLREGYLQENLDYTIFWIAGMAAYKEFNYKKALNFFNEALKFAGDEEYAIDTYVLLGLIYTNLGEYKKGLEYHEKALELYLNADKFNSADLAAYYNNIAVSYQYLTDYNQAYEYFEKTLKIVEESNNPANLANVHNNIALAINHLYKDRGKALEHLGKAEKIYREANEIPSKIREEGLATVYNNTATVYNDLERSEDAINYFRKTEQVFEKHLDPYHPDLALLYNNIATVYGHIENFDQATAYFSKAIEIQDSTLPVNHPSRINTYFNIAVTYMDQKEFKDALAYFLKQTETMEQYPNLVNSTLITALQKIGEIYKKQGNTVEADKYFTKAIKWQDKVEVLPRDSIAALKNRIHVYSNKASLHMDKGDYDEAIKYYQMALDLQKTLPPNQSELSIPIKNLANAYNAQALSYDNKIDFDKAVSSYKKGLDLLIPIVGMSDSSTVFIQKNMAIGYGNQAYFNAERDSFERAIALYKEAISTLKLINFDPKDKTIDEMYTSMAMVYNRKGYLFGEQKEFDKAISAYKDAEKTLLDVGQVNSKELAMIYRNIGTSYWNADKIKESEPYVQKAVNAFKANLPDEQKNYSESLKFLNQVRSHLKK